MSAPQEQNAVQPVQAAPGDREASTQVSPVTKAHASSKTLHAQRLELHNTLLANREKRLREEAPPTPDTDELNKLPPPRGGVPSVELNNSPPPRHQRQLEGVATTIPTRRPEIKTIPTFKGKSVESQITPPYEDRHLQMHLYSRLLPALRTAIANYHKFLHTRQDLVYRASTLEEDLRRSSALPLLQPRDTSNAQNQGSKSKSY
ncbi:hypothetical protein K504DRAFT_454239 [Pleomassaria siparia CBS 279.74]|uniref:Uncharacterized protein n=1 Tax=Pleomassaria siparia CBS 279.74 TaxID=1314801 RepID=A0A6G1JQF3_9PLEO|nr:hypothetical protein K504DRAFT_454239 [Pleomassaria siparia CBS 279.74]